MSKEELKEITEELFEDLKDLKIKLGRIGKFNPEEAYKTYEIIVEVIKTLEQYSTEIRELTGAERKEVAVDLINDIVDIPFMPDFVEGALIGWSIDLAVHAFNRAGGNEWLSVLFPPESDEEE